MSSECRCVAYLTFVVSPIRHNSTRHTATKHTTTFGRRIGNVVDTDGDIQQTG